ncbi:hypothetical protein HanRHA438_Chr17g0836721 [Helianthus annuus]|nr:hypothetical protein HanRHA438_Chr17g0836721 [Helianthus annuus]
MSWVVFELVIIFKKMVFFFFFFVIYMRTGLFSNALIPHIHLDRHMFRTHVWLVTNQTRPLNH